MIEESSRKLFSQVQGVWEPALLLLLAVGIVVIAVVAGNEGISQAMREVLGLLASGELTNNVVGDIMGSAYRLTGYLGDLVQQAGILLTILHWNLLAVLNGNLLAILDRSRVLNWCLVLDRSLLSILGIVTACRNRDIRNRLRPISCIREVRSSVDRLSGTIFLVGELGTSVDGVLVLVSQVIGQRVQITASIERNLGSVIDTLSLAVVMDLPGCKSSNVSMTLTGSWK